MERAGVALGTSGVSDPFAELHDYDLNIVLVQQNRAVPVLVKFPCRGRTEAEVGEAVRLRCLITND